MITVVARPNGGTGVRVDAQVQKIIPRPGGEQIPNRARVLTVTVGRSHHRPSASRTVTNRVQVHRIAAMINRLQTEQPEAINCPSYPPRPLVVTFTFRARVHSGVLARAREPADATEPTTPCDPMTLVIEDRRWTPLLGGAAVVHRVQRMLGVKLHPTGVLRGALILAGGPYNPRPRPLAGRVAVFSSAVQRLRHVHAAPEWFLTGHQVRRERVRAGQDFRFSLAPGRYWLERAGGSDCRPTPAVVHADQTTRANVDVGCGVR